MPSRTRNGRCSRCRTSCWRPGRRLTGPADMSLVALAVGLVVFAGLFAMTDAALSAVSPARVTEMEREGVRGARVLYALVGDRREFARHVSLLLLLRLACELSATTAIAIATIR